MPKQLDTVSRQPSPKATDKPESSTDKKPSEPNIPETGNLSSDTPADNPQTQQDEYSSLFPEPGVTINPPPNWIWWLLVLLGSLIIGAAGYQYIRSNLDKWLSVQPPAASTTPQQALAVPEEQPSASPTASPSIEPSPSATPSETPVPSPTPSPSPTASSSPAIQKSAISIRVLNGTTKVGAAAATQKILTDSGFTVRTIGNAKTQSYTQTNIYYQTGHLAEAELVKIALASLNPVLIEDSGIATPDLVAVVVGP